MAFVRSNNDGEPRASEDSSHPDKSNSEASSSVVAWRKSMDTHVCRHDQQRQACHSHPQRHPRPDRCELPRVRAMSLRCVRSVCLCISTGMSTLLSMYLLARWDLHGLQHFRSKRHELRHLSHCHNGHFFHELSVRFWNGLGHFKSFLLKLGLGSSKTSTNSFKVGCTGASTNCSRVRSEMRSSGVIHKHFENVFHDMLHGPVHLHIENSRHDLRHGELVNLLHDALGTEFRGNCVRTLRDERCDAQTLRPR